VAARKKGGAKSRTAAHKTRPAIALDLPPRLLDPEMDAYFGKCMERFGFVPNVRKFSEGARLGDTIAANYRALAIRFDMAKKPATAAIASGVLAQAIMNRGRSDRRVAHRNADLVQTLDHVADREQTVHRTALMVDNADAA
jgi:hypothetical protein